ncbi:MAG: hypothetical protein HW406_1559 [Candidatus Brocadiaceae bacterium]|nr:hypothetical protein [Candidatus Brocadiaceae bacterium]
MEKLLIKQFKDNLESQINNNIISALKEDEWLLESVGLGTLKSNNLLPTPEQAVKAKDIYEAFIRYDDKPMITRAEAVAKSGLKYCYNAEYCIATGDGKNYTKFFFQENVPFFDINDTTYWLVDKSLKPQQTATPLTNEKGEVIIPPSAVNVPPDTKITDGKNEIGSAKKFKSITVSGKVPLEQYTSLFNYFIAPFTMSGNKLDIEVKFKIKSTESNTIDESKQQYKAAKEASKQLGLNFEEDV